MPRTDNLYELLQDLPPPVDDGAATTRRERNSPRCSYLQPREISWACRACRAELSYAAARARGGQAKVCCRGEMRSRAFAGARHNRAPSETTTLSSKALERRYSASPRKIPDNGRRQAERLHLPFALLSDSERKYARALESPTFQVEQMVLIERLTLVTKDGRIEKALYSVSSPGKNAAKVIVWPHPGPREKL